MTGRKGREVGHAVKCEMGSKWSGRVRVEGFEERGERNEMRNGLNPAYRFCRHGIPCPSSVEELQNLRDQRVGFLAAGGGSKERQYRLIAFTWSRR